MRWLYNPNQIKAMTEIENIKEILKQIHSREQEKKEQSNLYNHHYNVISVFYDSCKVSTSVTPLLHTTSISPVRKYKFLDSGCGDVWV